MVSRLAPVLAEKERSGVVVACPEHALPFGVIFEEYKARREGDLARYVREQYQLDGTADPWQYLQRQLEDRNKLYTELSNLKKDPQTAPTKVEAVEQQCHNLDVGLKRILHKMQGSALCFSGGGIRSASFCLGILQALARFSLGILDSRQNHGVNDRGFLHELDYVSTVSGGGYIGSWFTAWVYRNRKAVLEKPEAELNLAIARRKEVENGSTSWSSLLTRPREFVDTMRLDPKTRMAAERDRFLAAAKADEQKARTKFEQLKASAWGCSYGNVLGALAGKANFTSGDPAPRPVRHLRDYTAYLAPSMGLSLDSWDLIAIVLRNLFINWLMLTPLLLAAVALVQMSYQFSHATAQKWIQPYPMQVLVGVALFLLIAAVTAGRGLPSHRDPSKSGISPRGVFLFFALPVFFANWLMVHLWKSEQSVELMKWDLAKRLVLLISLAGFLTLAGFLFWSYVKGVRRLGKSELVSWKKLVLMLIAGGVAAEVTTELIALLTTKVFPVLVHGFTIANRHIGADEKLFTILGLPLIGIVLLITASLFSGLVGVFEDEIDREWWSRVGGLQLSVIAAWVVAHIIVLYSHDAISAIWSAVAGAVLGGLSSWLGWSGATSAGPRPVKVEQLSKVGAFFTKHNLILPVLSLIAVLLVIIGAAGVEYQVANGDSGTLRTHLVVFAISLILAGLLNWAINVNLFSLHGMYRMRLMRAFLGASNSQHNPDAFTNFDPNDTPLMSELPASAGVPLHVVNTTLNLVGTKKLSWRQRKAEPFSFSAQYCGSWRLGYVPTEQYAGDKGVSLATAVAISGAAFNPNMGYHSSPLVTLVMTFFNVRLGWWLPNPARELGGWFGARGLKFLQKSGPTLALRPLIQEALGMTDDTYRWIELTDGGHFENLALYEMVLRRCHRIVVVDAGADPKCQFEDLGNALRKLEIDLGIPIRFDNNLEMKEGAQPGNRYCAVAKIDYGCVDADDTMSAEDRAGLAGTLIYIKAGIRGNEPPDIRQYSLTHPTFPHETTANQFFNESQFESYRHLGSYIVETMVNDGANKARSECPVGTDFDSLKRAALAHSAG